MKPSLLDQITTSLRRLPAGRTLSRGPEVAGPCLVLLGAFATGCHEPSDAPPGADASPVTTVAVARIGREDLFKTVSISAEFRAYTEVTLHAKVSGYVDQMDVDFGDRVKKGQLLAVLDAPDLVAQLNNALATERKAEANYINAKTNYVRLVAVNQQNPNLIAQQDLDNAEANERVAFASRAAAEADVAKYRTLVGYLKITAPFDGVVTRRYVDPGALIQAGTASETQSMPLVRVSDNYRLRLDFDVSVDYVKDIHLRDSVQVRVDSLDGKTLTGIVSRFADEVEADTRTMMTELEVPNPNLELVPGMYATVVLKVERRSQALAIPTEAIATDKTTTVYLINPNHTIEERPITTGLETPTKFEVISGLKEGDLVMIGNRTQVHPGQKVQTKIIGSLAEQ